MHGVNRAICCSSMQCVGSFRAGLIPQRFSCGHDICTVDKSPAIVNRFQVDAGWIERSAATRRPRIDCVTGCTCILLAKKHGDEVGSQPRCCDMEGVKLSEMAELGSARGSHKRMASRVQSSGSSHLNKSHTISASDDIRARPGPEMHALTKGVREPRSASALSAARTTMSPTYRSKSSVVARSTAADVWLRDDGRASLSSRSRRPSEVAPCSRSGLSTAPANIASVARMSAEDFDASASTEWTSSRTAGAIVCATDPKIAAAAQARPTISALAGTPSWVRVERAVRMISRARRDCAPSVAALATDQIECQSHLDGGHAWCLLEPPEDGDCAFKGGPESQLGCRTHGQQRGAVSQVVA